MLPPKQTEYKAQRKPQWKLVIKNMSSYLQEKVLPQEPKKSFEGLVALKKVKVDLAPNVH